MSAIRLDVRGALRGLSRARAGSIAAILSVTLGVGANVAAFTALRSLVFHPLPYRYADRLAFVWGCSADGSTEYSRPALFEYFRQQRHVFSDVSLVRDASNDIQFDVAGADEAIRLSGARVAPNYFELLGVTPQLGRLFQGGSAEPDTVVLSDATWRHAFNADPSIIGRKILLTGTPYTVVGVTRQDFVFAYDARLWTNRQVKEMDFWIPLDPATMARGDIAYRIVARLRDGVSAETASSQLTAGWARSGFFQAKRSSAVCVVPFQKEITKAFAPMLWLLFIGSGLVTLIASANLATVLLARAVSTDRAAAIMLVLGARPFEIARRYALEGLLLSLPGGAGALLLASWMISVLRHSIPNSIPAGQQLELDGVTLGFAAGATLMVAVGAGALTALLGAGRALASRLSAGAHVTFGLAARRLWSSLLVVQIGLVCVLAVLALQAAERQTRIRDVRLGYQTDAIRSFKLGLGTRHGDGDARLRLIESAREELAALGFSVSFADGAPLRQSGVGWGFELPQHPEVGTVSAEGRFVDENYFALLGIPVLQGRGFEASDAGTAPWVALVNEAFARRYLLGRALGETLPFGETEPATIVGVVGNVRDQSVQAPARPVIYFSLKQCASDASKARVRVPRTFRALISTATSSPQLWSEVKRAMARVDATLPVQEPTLLADDVRAATSDFRLAGQVLALLAGIALLLALTGVYGVISYSVAQRSRELAVRLTLGATTLSLHGMLLAETLRRVGVALMLGIPAAFAMGRILQSHLFDSVATTPTMVASATILIASAAFAATLLASRRLSRFEPAATLHRD